MKKKLPRYPGWFSATFLQLTLCLTGAPGAGNRKIRGFQAILAQDGFWHLKKSRARAENGKMQFPGARGTFGGEIRTPQKFLPESAQLFFTFYGLADRTPTGGKSRNTGFLGHFGLGRPLARREILGGKQKNRNSLIEIEKRETNPLQLGPNTQS